LNRTLAKKSRSVTLSTYKPIQCYNPEDQHKKYIVIFFKIKVYLLPADKVTQVCSVTPLSLIIVGGCGGIRKGESAGRGAEVIVAPH
jgi:hypothetical protein